MVDRTGRRGWLLTRVVDRNLHGQWLIKKNTVHQGKHNTVKQFIMLHGGLLDITLTVKMMWIKANMEQIAAGEAFILEAVISREKRETTSRADGRHSDRWLLRPE